jgi:acyl-coenzyme A thioesterase PaaI-like protein
MAMIYTWENYHDFINNVPAPAEDLQYFTTIPWLEPYLDTRGPYRPVPFFSRIEKETTLDRFFYKTINTPSTIPHAIALTRRDEHDWERRLSEVSSDNAGIQTTAKDREPTEWDFVLLAHLCPDLSGFRDTAHGGVLGILFDEAMGCCTAAFRSAPSEKGTQLFTANLNVSYRATVELPCVVAIRVRLLRRQGRKWFLKGELVGSDGQVKTDAESLWISTKPKERL